MLQEREWCKTATWRSIIGWGHVARNMIGRNRSNVEIYKVERAGSAVLVVMFEEWEKERDREIYLFIYLFRSQKREKNHSSELRLIISELGFQWEWAMGEGKRIVLALLLFFVASSSFHLLSASSDDADDAVIHNCEIPIIVFITIIMKMIINVLKAWFF